MQKQTVKQLYQETPTVTKLTLIAEKAKEDKNAKFYSLHYLLNEKYLLECYALLKKRKAAGIDGRTVESYTEQEIAQEINTLAQSIKQRRYTPQPVRRVSIDKENGKKRQLGIPTVMDKIVQMAIARILTAIFDSSFTESSFGYRKARDAHECLKAVNHMIMQEKVNYIIDADITGFFDHISHEKMMPWLEQRIADQKLLSIIWKFLKAGVMDKDHFEETDEGTPQGGIISPVLSNIFLHYVLDLWMQVKETKKLRGYAKLIRYADDFLVGVQYKHEAELLHTDIEYRLSKFGLTLSAEKTKILEFGRFAEENVRKKGKRKPETFTFLGMTHYCDTTLDGRFSVRVQTSSKKLRKAATSMNSFLRKKRNTPLKELWEDIGLKLTGHYNYYGVSGNLRKLLRFYRITRELTYKWLNRRSQRRSFDWDEFERYLQFNPLPIPKLTYALFNTW